METHRRKSALNRHIRHIQAGIDRLESAKNRFSRFRPVVFFSGVVLAVWWGWTPFLIAFGLICCDMVYVSRLQRVIDRHGLWLDIKTTQRARIDLDWDAIPCTSSDSPDSGHPFETDLGITGERSLLHLLDMSISREGSGCLRAWLLEPNLQLDAIQARQRQVQELIPLSRFRDKLLLNFKLVSKEQLDGQKLLQWLQAHAPSKKLRLALPVAAALCFLNLTLLAGYALGWIPGYWIFSFMAYIGVYFWYQGELQYTFDAVMLFDDELRKFKAILRYLESYSYQSTPHLKRLCAPFFDPATLPSRILRTVTLLTTAVGLRMNPVLAMLLNAVLPWDIVTGFLITRCQAHCSRAFPLWVQSWSELEGLVSLANFAYLNPGYTFPEIVDDSAEPPLFQAVALGHPLIPAGHKICNDVQFLQTGEMGLITGSNMAGKSTFLKTIGVNVCLAYAGGPVNAVRLRTRILRVFTCMQIHDSIADGLSFFYAEVKRLKRLLTLLQDGNSTPVLYLIDEIFRGTNSRERLIGSRAYIHYLSTQPGIGLIATHDLELGQLEQAIASLTNFHFRDTVSDGVMKFDYTLHPGVCPTTNALKIMRLEGLPLA